MKRNQLIGGIGMFILAAYIFRFAETAVLIPIALMIVGTALITRSRKGEHRWQS